MARTVESDERPQSRLTLVVFILTIALAWGLMYSSYKVGLERAGPLWLASLRFEAFAIAALVAILFLRGAPTLPRGPADWTAVGAYAGLNVILHNLGTIGGAGHVPVAIIGILAGTTPILTAGFARIVTPYHALNRATILGLAFGFAGVSVLALQRPTGGPIGFSPWTLVVLGGFACWALGTVLIRASHSKIDGLSLGLWGSVIAVAILQPVALLVEPLPTFDATLLAVAAFAGVVGGVIAFLLWLGLVRRYGPRQANLVSFVSPIATTLSGVVFLNEEVRPIAFLAYALVSVGLASAVRGLARLEPTTTSVAARTTTVAR